MTNNSLRSDEFSQYIITIERKFRPLVKALRELILETIPDISEEVKWDNLCYSKEKKLFYIKAFRGHVEVFFENGAALTNIDGLLQGTGKSLRSVKYKSIDEIDEEQLVSWLEEVQKVESL